MTWRGRLRLRTGLAASLSNPEANAEELRGAPWSDLWTVLRDESIEIHGLDNAEQGCASCDATWEQRRHLVGVPPRFHLIIDAEDSHQSFATRELVVSCDEVLSHDFMTLLPVLRLRHSSRRPGRCCGASNLTPNWARTERSLASASMKKTGYDDAYSDLREILVTARRSAGWSQEKLATKLGRAQTFVSKIELGERRLDLIELLVWADLLDLDAHAVIDRLQKKVRRKPTR
jgi:hypothetical protein